MLRLHEKENIHALLDFYDTKILKMDKFSMPNFQVEKTQNKHMHQPTKEDRECLSEELI